MTPKQAISRTLFWVSLSFLFGGFIYYQYGMQTASQYFACYGIEKLLSLDNLLMFYVIFKYFEVTPSKQKRLLNIGVISSFILRGIMIFSGGYLLHKLPWLSYAFAAFLAYSAWQLVFGREDSANDNEPNAVIRFCDNWLPSLSRAAFIIAVTELTDVLFALDSIPAAFGITTNPLIIYSANLFAILGLRSMYFVMLDIIPRFVWLEKIIAIVLVFVALKMGVQTYLGV